MITPDMIPDALKLPLAMLSCTLIVLFVLNDWVAGKQIKNLYKMVKRLRGEIAWRDELLIANDRRRNGLTEEIEILRKTLRDIVRQCNNSLYGSAPGMERMIDRIEDMAIEALGSNNTKKGECDAATP